MRPTGRRSNDPDVPRVLFAHLFVCFPEFSSFLGMIAGIALAACGYKSYQIEMEYRRNVAPGLESNAATHCVAILTKIQLRAFRGCIDRIKYNRTVRGDFTPGEQKMMGAYRLAAYQMSQEYAKTHSPAEAQAFDRLHGQYETNSAFYQDWSKRPLPCIKHDKQC